MIPIAKPTLGREEISSVVSVLRSGNLTAGEKVRQFEQQFSSFIGARHGIACSSGTSALQVGLEAVGVREGDDVITTPFTFIATANAILYNRARPVFCDIDPATFNMDPEKVRRMITPKTRAVLAVHLYGQACDMKHLQEVCDEKGVMIVEDACQAHGAEHRGRKAGSFGRLSTFSFYATKNMITGEGGMMLTDDDSVAEKARAIVNQGQSSRYEHVMVGFNYRMMDIQAAIGISQLARLGYMNRKRERNAALLTKGLSGIEWLETPRVSEGSKHAWHQYTIKVRAGMRDGLLQYLNARGIGARVYYPKPCHMQPVYQSMGFRHGICPVAEEMSGRVLSLPVHPSVAVPQVKEIVDAVRAYG